VYQVRDIDGLTRPMAQVESGAAGIDSIFAAAE